MIKIEKEHSYGILAIVVIVAIVAIFNLSSSEITTTTESSLEKENLAGEGIRSLNRMASESKSEIASKVELTKLNVDQSMLDCEVVMQDPSNPSQTLMIGCTPNGLAPQVLNDHWGDWLYQTTGDEFCTNLILNGDFAGACKGSGGSGSGGSGGGNYDPSLADLLNLANSDLNLSNDHF